MTFSLSQIRQIMRSFTIIFYYSILKRSHPKSCRPFVSHFEFAVWAVCFHLFDFWLLYQLIDLAAHAFHLIPGFPGLEICLLFCTHRICFTKICPPKKIFLFNSPFGSPFLIFLPSCLPPTPGGSCQKYSSFVAYNGNDMTWTQTLEPPKDFFEEGC